MRWTRVHAEAARHLQMSRNLNHERHAQTCTRHNIQPLHYASCEKISAIERKQPVVRGSASAPSLFNVFAVRFLLAKDHAVVGAARAHKLLVAPPLDDATIFHQ